jgi:3-deoxy-D-manno-octulosonic-acid transferase
MRDIFFFAAPRHLSKIDAVKRVLENKKIDYALFSEIVKGEKLNKNFILVDVFGKLQGIYSVSDICFVGGSIANKGGQNPIEPAACAKPVLFGKYMDNFKTEAEILLKYAGAITVSGAPDIADKTEKLFLDKDFLKKTGENALKAVNSQKGALNVTVNKIREMLN